MDDIALLVIDAQVNMFEPEPVYGGSTLLSKLEYFIPKARTAGLPIIYIQNCGGEGEPDEPNTPGWEIHPAVVPQENDLIIQKYDPDSFSQTPLQAELEARGIKKLIVSGMQTEMCINSTCRRASELGYEVILVSDLHSTFDTDALTAPQVIAHFNDTLGEFATVVEAGKIKF